MPYYTRKGTSKKDKGKTCVYKKEDNTKVGCTDGPVEKYLAALHINESKENNDLSWISEIGGDIEKFIQELSKLIKEHVPVADLELDWDTTNGGGEYFGRIWLYDTFYELYKYGKTFTVRFYRLDPETDEYYQFDSYEDLSQTRLLTVLLNDMISVNKKNLNESEEEGVEWMKGPAQLRFGDIKDNFLDYFSAGDKIYVTGLLYVTDIDHNTPIVLDNEPAIVKSIVHKNRIDIIFGENITNLPIWFDNMGGDYADLGAFDSDNDLLITIPEKKNITESNEEDELEWIKGVETDLVPGEIYDIKTGNGYYWVPEIYVGKKWDNEHQVEMYKFKDLDGGGSGGKSVPYVKDLIEKGNIRPYDPNWSIKDELTFSDNIEDALKGNFVIYFKDGVDLDQTLPIQDKLFEMGFSFYTKGPNEYITNKDSSDKIQFFESFNWDTSNPRYNMMPSDQWDKKKILLSKVKDDEFSWRRKPNPRLDEQELFITIRDHDAIVINGDKYITQNISETNTSISSGLYSGPIELGLRKWDNSNLKPFTNFVKTEFNNNKKQKTLKNNIKRSVGVWEKNKNGSYNIKKYDVHSVNESEEFDWIQKQEPEKGLKKSKRYVIDVSHLRPTPMRFSHDTSLTKQDILRKLGDLGYDVEHIDVDGAKYFYVEPTNRGASWQYDEYDTPIQFNYWVDYDTDLMDDPSHGGKYQMINVDEFMFLIDNNLISESDESMSWLMTSLGEPMSICEAQSELKVGDIVMINELEDWVSGGIKENVTAEILAIDYLQQIQPDNRSNLKTILVHVNDDYVGFDDHWVRYFKPKYIDRCLDGRCMFLICGDKGFKGTMVTLMNGNLLESKKPINEAAGISFESREWSDIIYNEIINNPYEKTRFIIDGYDYPETFDKFPIDYIVVDYYDKLTGYDVERSGFDKDGNYVVLLYVQPELVNGQREYTLKSALNHEMRHAWEDYNRISRGRPNIDQSKESKDLYTKDFIKLMSDDKVVGPIKDVLKYFYYLSKLETGPYMENVYDQNPAYEDLVRNIVTKDFESFKDRFDLELNWHLINTNYDIPFTKKFKSATDFIDYSAKELRKRANKVIKKINKVKYVHGKMN
jgi:hypothetical protein